MIATATRPRRDTVIYDGHCRFCRSQIALLRRLDLAGSLDYVSQHDPAVPRDFPELSADDLHAQVRAALAGIGDVTEIEPLPAFMHAFTHYRLFVTPLKITLARRETVAGQSGYFWCEELALKDAALPSPVKKLLCGA